MGSLIYMEGFDLYNSNATDIGFGSKVSMGYSPQVLMAAGRFGGQCLKIDGGGGYETQWLTLPSSIPLLGTFTYGFAFKRGAFTARALDLWNAGGSTIVSIHANSDGSLTVYKDGFSTVVGTTATGFVATNAWSYIELTFTLHTSAGVCKLWVDGVQALNLTGVNTIGGNSAPITRLNYPETGSGPTYFDDVYIRDDATRYGSCRIEALQPTTDVAGGNFTQSTGASVASCVDEIISNGDTDYGSASAVNDRQLFELTDLIGAADTVFAVQVVTNARKVDAAGRAIRHIISNGSAEIIGSSDKVLGTTYNFHDTIYETAPDAGSWSLAKVNALKAGIKVTV